MKNHRFPWLRNRTTDNRKCEKARNIKEKRTIEMFSTVSRLHVAHCSSPSEMFMNDLKDEYRKAGEKLSIYRRFHNKVDTCAF